MWADVTGTSTFAAMAALNSGKPESSRRARPMVRRAGLTLTVAALLLGSGALTDDPLTDDQQTATKTVTSFIVPKRSWSATQGTLVG
jgi:hypothetical protein